MLVGSVAGALIASGPGAGTADGACILRVEYLGVPFDGRASLAADDVGRRVGTVRVPACNDTPGGPVRPDTVAGVRRVHGVAPRFAVALGAGGGSSALVVRATGSCRRTRGAPATLACLRRLTRRYLHGPTLIAPVSARPGAVVRLAVRVGDPRVARRLVIGVGALLERREDGRWVPRFRLAGAVGAGAPPDPVPVATPGDFVPAVGPMAGAVRRVRLPAEPGLYRLVQAIELRGERRALRTGITIPPASG